MKFENIRVYNFEHALRGMRHPKESYHLIDSHFGLGTFEESQDIINDVAFSWAVKDKDYDNVTNEEVEEYKHWLFNNAYTNQYGNYCEWAAIGPKDMNLAQRLIKGGSEHRKFLRQIFVTVDITAPLFW